MKANIGNTGVCVASIALMLTVSLSPQAAQFDAEYYELEKQFGKQWLADDKKIQSKLAELEKKWLSGTFRVS